MKFLLCSLLFSITANAQHYENDPSHADINALKQTGSLVSIQIVPKSPLKIFVVGREEAKFDLSHLKLFVRRLNQGAPQELKTLREGDHFVVSDEIKWDNPTDLEVTAQ